jgi:hypothetical protein
MTIMDDFVKKTEEGIIALKETAEGVAFNLEKQARIAGKKVDVLRIERKVRKVYGEIGEYVYGEYVAGRQIVPETLFLRQRMASISEMKRAIEEIEADIVVLREAQPAGRDESPPSGEKKDEETAS